MLAAGWKGASLLEVQKLSAEARDEADGADMIARMASRHGGGVTPDESPDEEERVLLDRTPGTAAGVCSR